MISAMSLWVRFLEYIRKQVQSGVDCGGMGYKYLVIVNEDIKEPSRLSFLHAAQVLACTDRALPQLPSRQLQVDYLMEFHLVVCTPW